MYNKIIYCLSAALILAGCEIYSQDGFRQEYVVEAYLIANRSLPQVLISRTLPIDEEYSFTRGAVNDANVEIHLLNNTGEPEETYEYTRQSSGIYVPLQNDLVRPLRSYRLHVTFDGNPDEVTATTIVPGDFSAIGSTVDSVSYQSTDQIEVDTSPSFYPGRQTFYIFSIKAANPDSSNLTPFYLDRVLEEESEISEFFINSSGIINEENYDVNSDGTITLKVPWLAIAFYEHNFVIANAIDDNIYDFFRSQDVQTGGTVLPPGEIQNVIYRVEGGIGLFGSMSSDTVSVFIEREAQPN